MGTLSKRLGKRKNRNMSYHAQTPLVATADMDECISGQIQSGRLTPYNLTIDTSIEGADVIPDKNKPWADLGGFNAYVKEKVTTLRIRLRLPFFAKRHSLRSEAPRRIDTSMKKPSPVIQDNQTIHPFTFDLTNPRRSLSSTGEARRKHVPTTTSNITRDEIPKVNSIFDSHLETDVDSTGKSGVSANSSLAKEEDKPESDSAPARSNDGRWATSIVTIKDVLDTESWTEILYDTGSEKNWASEEFIKKFHIEPRPIRHGDIRIYQTANGNVSPDQYAEITLKDPHHNIEYTTKSFNITDQFSEVLLIAGREFMEEHNVRLRPSASHDAFITTSGKPSISMTPSSKLLSSANSFPEARKAKAELTAAAAQDRSYAQQILSSSASTSTAERSTMQTANSSSKQQTISTETSTSSSAQQVLEKR